jgi:serine/threonine-protein kinase
MKNDDLARELARLGERPATPEEEAEALRTEEELERHLRGEPPVPDHPGVSPELGTTIHWLGEHVDRVVDRAHAFELEELKRLFPQFEPIEQIGRGGMGVVYLVQHVWLDCPVALKVLPLEVSHGSEFLERFRREARAMARLNHPGIARVMDFNKSIEGDFYYLAMEYLPGGALRDRLREGPLRPEVALALAAAVCDALQYAHDKEVIHRDVKPDNILFDREGNVKVADLGLARVCGDVRLTGSVQGMGTLDYMAPEQRESAATVDNRADVYSVGVVLCEMLTKKRHKDQSLLRAVGAPVDVDEIIDCALQRDPNRRFKSAADMKGAINNALEHMTFATTEQEAEREKKERG